MTRSETRFAAQLDWQRFCWEYLREQSRRKKCRRFIAVQDDAIISLGDNKTRVLSEALDETESNSPVFVAEVVFALEPEEVCSSREWREKVEQMRIKNANNFRLTGS